MTMILMRHALPVNAFSVIDLFCLV